MLKELGKAFLIRLKKVLQYKYFWFLIFFIFIVFSYLRTTFIKKSNYRGYETEFNVVVIEKKKKNDKYTIVLKEKEKLISTIDNFPYDVGDIIYIKGNLEKVKKNTIPNTFNYEKYLQSKNISWQLKINSVKLVKENSNLWNKIKKIIVKRIERIPYKEYLYAFLLGDTSYFNKNIRNKYQLSGLSYILAIGSLQVMIVLKILNTIETRFKIKRLNKLITNILIIIFYIIFTSGIIGVLRTGLCYIIKSILDYKKINTKYHNIILIVGIILLIINPYYINDIGFLYSFSISLVISLMQGKIKGNYARRLLIISLIAFIVGLPITIYNNYEVNFLAWFISLILAPVFNFMVFPLCIIVLIFPFISPIFSLIISIIENIVNIFSNILFLTFTFRKISMFVIILYYIAITLLFWKMKYFFLLLIILFLHYNINHIIQEDLVTFLDVKEGDAIIIKSNNELSLIDTGGSNYYEYSDEIVKYIKSLGVNKITKMFLTHGDYDHMGSSYNLVNKIKVDNIYFNNNDYNLNEKQLINILNKKRIPYQKINTYIYQMNNYVIKVKSYNLDTENDSSMMFFISNRNIKMILMGDATIKSEKLLMRDYELSKYHILKVGHHGSKSSTSNIFYNTINPNISIISVGNKNIYHLPHYEVLKRINNSKVYLTSKSGSITLKFNNKKLLIEESVS